MKNSHPFVILLILLLPCCLISCSPAGENGQTVIWKTGNPVEIGGHPVEIIGSPEVVSGETGTSVYFNGKGDGLILPVNPVGGWDRFTVEVLFKPDVSGPEEQRFVHFQDDDGNRGLIETRVNPDGSWSLDTFLYNSGDDTGLTLLDRGITHPGGEWYWAALMYDGQTMSHYVNGNRELAGEIAFEAAASGKISLGMRMNQVHWFKGHIRELRFHNDAVPAESLQRE